MKNMSHSRKKIAKNRKIVNRKIREEFTLKNATLYGGYNLYSDTVARNGLDRLLEEQFGGCKAWWATYNMPTILRILIDGYALGLERIWHFKEIKNDPLLAAKHDLKSLPDQSVLRKDLIRHFQCEQDVNRLRRIKASNARGVIKRLNGPLVLEFDSTAETVYGRQKGARVGYNPDKRGRASYQPQLCREGRMRLNLWSRLRPGDTVGSSDFVDFVEECWEVIPKRFKRRRRGGLCDILARADSGHENDESLRWFEDHGVGYVVKMTMKGNVLGRVWNIPNRAYRKVETEAGTIELCSMEFQRDKWSQPRRVVVVRWPNETDRAQTKLFDILGYTYAIFVTNLKWDEQDIYRFYDKRADVENHILEAKADFGIGHIPTGEFYANAADLELRLLALNQLSAFLS